MPAFAAVLALSLPGAALAKGGGGGGGGGGTTTPPPVESTFNCIDAAAGDGVQPDGSSIFTNQAGTAGCVIAKVSATATVSLVGVVVNSAEGWTYVVNSGGGTNGRVDVTFTNTKTRQTINARIEPGKTRIG